MTSQEVAHDMTVEYSAPTVYAAEGIGTAILVIGGVGTAVLAGDTVGTPGIALAFGLTLLALAFSIGPISGCHVNPAVTLGAMLAGRISAVRAAGYVVAQLVGALVGAAVVLAIASGRPGYDKAVDGLGTNGYGSASTGGYGLVPVAITEIVLTALLVGVVLAVTAPHAPSAAVGVPIGLTLTVIHLIAIGIDSTSVNPARSFGPALLAGDLALSQLWVFVVFPLIGGALAAGVYRLLDAGRNRTA
ncbi:aquaporin Z [Rhodococcoides trifolii]|uniref:Aquaporin Z n=1 Tax=Rhodococcoides trifolii TaxID=908250 RepID=A0A917G2L8_9NOCA|nr:aquaporin [Rhodococcus trifolii]GGG20071.1 aquaporin Z [Rhodococcus trifolii]